MTNTQLEQLKAVYGHAEDEGFTDAGVGGNLRCILPTFRQAISDAEAGGWHD